MSALGLAALHAAAAPPLNTHAIGRDSTSTLNSQHSSFEGSPNSQYSLPHTFQESSLRTSQQGDQGRITPPTSLSNPSSQDELAVKSRSAGHVAAVKKGTSSAVRSDAVSVDTECKDGGSPQVVCAVNQPHAAPKRTADGHMKPSTAVVINGAPDQGHRSRTSSTASRNSSVSELSHQLKTRLSYAMLKVQNGWQDRSIDELETMASQPCSPISATALSHRSRRSSHSLLQRPPTSSRSIPNGSPKLGTVGQMLRNPQLGGSPTSRPSPRSVALSHRGDIKSPPTSNNRSRWEDPHTRHHHHGELHPTKNGYHPLTLASPVKITTHEPPTSTSTSTTTSHPKQPSHSKHNSLGSPFQRSTQQSQPAATPSIHIPATPPPPSSTMKPPPLRTPSQNAAMEADAVETLLFMSSPQNITHPRSAKTKAPVLRNQRGGFSPLDDGRRRGYLSVSPPLVNGNRGDGLMMSGMGLERETRKRRGERTVDQMIDEVESSSDDDDDDDEIDDDDGRDDDGMV